MSRDSDPAHADEIEELIGEAEILLSIARCSSLQEKAIRSLDRMLDRVIRSKRTAIAHSKEESANRLLGYEWVIRSLAAELKMWRLLKREEPDCAWDELVAAQQASLSALRAHDIFRNAEDRYLRLEAIEKLVFPPQIFVSAGLVAEGLDCSICEEDYEDCCHVAGRPYMGRFCAMRPRGLRLDHVAIVEDPVDKGLRIREFPVDGGFRSRMTWRVSQDASGEPGRGLARGCI